MRATGIALDSATRGLRTCLVESSDFGAGTSSRSTKLLHGGMRYAFVCPGACGISRGRTASCRYLEKAVTNFDLGQLGLVFDALKERSQVIRNAPHLAHSLSIVVPVGNWWEMPYLWIGAFARGRACVGVCLCVCGLRGADPPKQAASCTTG